MDIKEAIGIHKCNIDIETGERPSHSEIYGRAIEYLGGLDEVAEFVPFPVETLREKLREDPNLNNTPLSTWDKAAGFKCGTWEMFGARGISVCWRVAASGSYTRNMASRLPAVLMEFAS